MRSKVIEKLSSRLEVLAKSDKDKTEVQAFSYALSPRLRRAYAVNQSEQSAATENWFGSWLGLSSRESLAGETSEPEIISYIPPARNGDTQGLVARFDWVVGPERQGPAPWQHSLSVQEAELGALVAVPSWWRTVLLRICPGFVKGSNLLLSQAPMLRCKIG